MSRGQNRPAEKRAKLDQYWTGDQLAQACVDLLPIQHWETALEPHVGGGAFARALKAAGAASVDGWDLDHSVPGAQDCDRFMCRDARVAPRVGHWDWAVGNPPFVEIGEQVEILLLTCRNVAFLAPLALQESGGRVKFWERTRRHLRGYWVLAERADFLRVGGLETGQGSLFQQEAVVSDEGEGFNTALAFYWWDKRWSGPPEHFVPGWSWK